MQSPLDHNSRSREGGMGEGREGCNGAMELEAKGRIVFRVAYDVDENPGDSI
jgi:hypothetical protein